MPDLNTLLDDHVTLNYESVDRIFLNGYVAKLQEPDQLSGSFASIEARKSHVTSCWAG